MQKATLQRQQTLALLQSKPLMRKVRTSRRYLLAEKRAIHGTLNIILGTKLFCLIYYFVKPNEISAHSDNFHSP